VQLRVANAGGTVPSDQQSWKLPRLPLEDRFLDVNQDRSTRLPFRTAGGLAAGASSVPNERVAARAISSAVIRLRHHRFPAAHLGTGEAGRCANSGNEQNNATAAVQPILIATPPPADLRSRNVSCVAGHVGQQVQIQFTSQRFRQPGERALDRALYLSLATLGTSATSCSVASP